MKYSFLMPYKNREEQFFNTLLSLEHWYGDRDDWEVVVILDGADQTITMPDGLPVRAYTVQRDQVNPAPLFNLAARLATGTHLVITNPECYHVADVLGWYDRIFAQDPGGYAVAACDHVRHAGRVDEYRQKLGDFIEVYQHSWHRNVLYHWCSAMARETWDALGGFDERFGNGYACEDDDFRDRIWCSGIPCYTDNDVKVLHQQHAKSRWAGEDNWRYKHNMALLQDGRRRRGWTFSLRAMRSHATRHCIA